MKQETTLCAEYIDDILRHITALCKVCGPSGHTDGAAAYVEGELRALGFTPRRLNKGGVVCALGGACSPDAQAGGLVLSAHIDTIGAMVNFITSDGRLRVAAVGGLVLANLDSENCTVKTRDGREYTGTLQRDSPSTHVNGSVRDTVREAGNTAVVLDERVSSAEDVRALGIRNGDYIFFDPRTIITPSGYIKSRYIDDLALAALLLTFAKYTRGNPPQRAVTLLFTDFEEVGHGGAAGIPEGTRDFIAVDIALVGAEYDGSEHTVSIVAKDSVSPLNYALTTELIKCAEERGIPHAVDVFPERYGSDADAALRAGYDIRTALIGPGTSATHGYERTHRDALEATLALLCAYICT